MKTWIAIGDIHGRTVWKDIVEMELHQVDRIIFVGDYFDSFTIPMQEQIKNFVEIVNLAREYPDKVVLLIGNHDYHYLSMGETYSGFNRTYALGIEHDYLRPNLDLFKMCHQEDNFLFSHAGISQRWLDMVFSTVTDVSAQINDLWHYTPYAFSFRRNPVNKISSWTDPTGDDIWQGPLWIRPYSLERSAIDGYTQIVGHSATSNIEVSTEPPIYYIDALSEEGPSSYLKFDGSECVAKQINFENE